MDINRRVNPGTMDVFGTDASVETVKGTKDLIVSASLVDIGDVKEDSLEGNTVGVF